MSPEEITATAQEIRDRVRERYQKRVPEVADFELPSLDGLGNARDAAEGHVASIGRVNPRPPGLVNNIVQGLKKLVGRALDWHIRDQVDFNRAVVRFMDTSDRGCRSRAEPQSPPGCSRVLPRSSRVMKSAITS